MRISFTAAVLATLLMARPAAAESVTGSEGGPGGSPFHLRCPAGSYLHGVRAKVGALMDFATPICAVLDPAQVRLAGFTDIGGAGGSGGTWADSECPQMDQVVTLLNVEKIAYLESGQHKSFVSDASVGCQRMGAPGDFDGASRAMRRGAGRQLARYDWAGVLSCPPGQWGVGIHGRAGRYIDRLGLICDAAFVPPPMAVPRPEIDPDLLQQGSGMFEETINPNATGN
jgi:hypothetical protein